MQNRLVIAASILFAAALSITACGGGGSGQPTAAPATPHFTVEAAQNQLVFRWLITPGATYYKLLENADGHSGFTQTGADIPANVLSTTRSVSVHLHDFVNALYIVQGCNQIGCTSSRAISPINSMLGTIGYFKASNTGWRDHFGAAVAMSADGNTLAVGAPLENSNAIGVNSDPNGLNEWTGAVYVFRFDGTVWSQQAYIKASRVGIRIEFGSSIALSADGNTLAVGAPKEGGVPVNDHGAAYILRFDGTDWYHETRILGSNTGSNDSFGRTVVLNADGNTLVVGAPGESSKATGIDGDQFDDTSCCAGAAYVFRFNGSRWLQQAYIKASNTDPFDSFSSLAISADGNTLAVGAFAETSNATGINGDQNNNSAPVSGAVYLFRFNGTDWFQEAYIKASNTEAGDAFGGTVALSADGAVLAVGASEEDSNATGIGGDQSDNSARGSGAAYLFRFNGTDWFQEAYIKASNTGSQDSFGSVTLSADGAWLAVGAFGEDSNATGINGGQFDDSALSSGAVYLFRYDGTDWSQRAYVKASNTEAYDRFGAIALNADGTKLAVGALGEDSSATGIGGDQFDDQINDPCANCAAGAVYMY